MKRSFWLNVTLLLAVTVAGVLVYLEPQAEGPIEHALSALTPGAARSIRIERQGMRVVALERKDGGWFIVAPFSARADEFMVQRLLAILQARTVHRFAADNLARYDLEQPHARLIINGQRFEFGMVNELSREQYVRAGKAVFALSTRYGLALPTRPEALASRRLLAPGETPVRIAPPGFAVMKTGSRWVLNPAPHDWSQDEIDRWVDEWLSASAQRIEPYRQGEPEQSVQIELGDGRTLLVGILAHEPEVVLLRHDQGLQYHFAAQAGERLLSPPGAGRGRRTAKN